MSLVPSLLQAIVRVDGDALVMHAGDKPYVVSPTGQVDLASRGLSLEAVNGIVGQLLSLETRNALEEFGAVQYELPPAGEFPGEKFTVVAARGGDDLWVEVRRHRVPDDDRVPDELFAATPQAVEDDHVPADMLPPSSAEPTAVMAAAVPPGTAAGDDLGMPEAAHFFVTEPEPVIEEGPEAFEPIDEPASAPVPVIAAESEPVPEPHVAAPAPEATPAPEAQPEPVRTLEPEPALAPVQPEPVFEPQPVPAFEPEPEPVFVPPAIAEPAPMFAEAEPTPQAAAEPTPEPVVEPAPEPLSEPVPEPVPEPVVAAPVFVAPPMDAPPAIAASIEHFVVRELERLPEPVAAAPHVADEPEPVPVFVETPSAEAPPVPPMFVPAAVEIPAPIAAWVEYELHLEAEEMEPEPEPVAPAVADELMFVAPAIEMPEPIAASIEQETPYEPEFVPEPIAAEPEPTPPVPEPVPVFAEESAPEPVAEWRLEPLDESAAPEHVEPEPVHVQPEPDFVAPPTLPLEPESTPFAGEPFEEPSAPVFLPPPVAAPQPIAASIEPEFVREPAAIPELVTAFTSPAAPVSEVVPIFAELPAPDFTFEPEPIASWSVAPEAVESEAMFAAPAEEREEVRSEPAPEPAVVLPMARNPIRTEQAAASIGDPTMDGLQRLLRISAARGASTLYLSSDAKPSVRVDGELQSLDSEPVLTARDIESLLLTLMPERSHEALRTGAPSEWMTDIEDVGRVRCTTFRDHIGPGGVFRLMSTRTVSAEQLALPKSIQALAAEREGLILVVGPRSSGKRTLISAFVDLINRTRREHVITIEREINIVHSRVNSFVSQREVRGSDEDILAATRAALREDPDVLVVEDLRTAELVKLAFEAAASGRLVIAGFSAHTPAAAVDRIIDLHPAEDRLQVQLALADTLRGVVSQVLLRKSGGGRAAARELLLNTPAVASLITEGKTSQLPMAVEGGRRLGMLPLSDTLVSLVQSGVVNAREAYRHASDRAGLVAALKRQGVDTSDLTGTLA